IGVILHEQMGPSDEPQDLLETDIGILMMNCFGATSDGVMPFGQIVVVAGDAPTKAVVRDIQFSLGDAVGIDAEISLGHRHLPAVPGYGNEVDAQELTTVQPTQIIGV